MLRRVVFPLVAVLVAACSTPAPADLPATRIDLPATPVTLTEAGADLLVGVREGDKPGLVRRTAEGAVTAIPATSASPYGALARWKSIAVQGRQVVAIGGERGGAHGNFRWSVWTGDLGGVTEKPQGFSTFGGYGAGDLLGAVLTPEGGALVGTWNSAQSGLDIATWTANADTWQRRDSAGTPLESTKATLGFPLAVTADGNGVAVAGWQLRDKGEQVPTLWRSTTGVTAWTRTDLPGTGGAAMAVRCARTCVTAGRFEGRLAVWEGDTRLPNTPPIPVGDRDVLPRPLEVDGHLVQFATDAGRVIAAHQDGDAWSTRPLTGPSGVVTDAVVVGRDVFLLAGPDEDHLVLWEVDVASLG